MFAGIPAIFTGFKPNAFSLSLNQKLIKDSGKQSSELMTNLGAISLGIKQPPRIIREILETCADYSCAQAVLKSA
jgi:hypothetical protein